MMNYELNEYDQAYHFLGLKRAIMLETELGHLYEINDPNLTQLRSLLAVSSPYAIYEPSPQADETPDNGLGDTIRIRTSSDKKWLICATAVFYERFIPIREAPTDDEENIHKIMRRKGNSFPKWYPARVAKMKQADDPYETPLITMDTVTYIDGLPVEKPHTPEEAVRLIGKMSGKRVMTDTGWVLGMRLQSGARIQLLNSTRVSYKMLPLSSQAIRSYVENEANILGVPIGIDLSTLQARMQYIDLKSRVMFSAHNCFDHDRTLTLEGEDMRTSLFNAIFGGVPMHAIRAIVPTLPDIYQHADPFSKTGN